MLGKSMSINIMKSSTILQLGLGTKVLRDIQHYWDPGYQLTDQNIGCALICASNKLHLLQDNGDLDPYYAATFVRSAGGGNYQISCLSPSFIS
uniref:Odorant binding protein n=1 Tax=Glyphodes pyloalis TaxID=1242752 RepID=A0A6M3GRU0_GLYPY|nr:general odorant binding protein [Glyphodes pyloalis]